MLQLGLRGKPQARATFSILGSNQQHGAQTWTQDTMFSKWTAIFFRCWGKERGVGRRRKESEGVGSQYSEVPIIISSGFRSEEVNRLCGGARGSNHLTGCAVDIHCNGPEQMIRMAGILLDIADGTKRKFDELILEKRGSTYWIHFAVRPKENRRKILFDCR